LQVGEPKKSVSTEYAGETTQGLPLVVPVYRDQGPIIPQTFTAPDHVTASLINIPTKDAQRCTTSTQTVVNRPKMVHTGINCDLKKCDDKGTQVAPTMCSIATQTNRPTLTIEDVQENHKTLKHLTAIPSKECFMAIFSELSEDEEHLEAEVGKRKEGFEILALPQKQNQKKGRKGTEKR